MAQQETSNHRMQCMEIWGGNQFADSAVTLSGLDAWVHSRPQRKREAAAVATTSGGPTTGGGAGGGGDVHYVSSCASGRITRLLVADVSGHGESVNSIAIDLRNLMRRFVNYINPASFMAAMNRQFTAMTEIGCFATALVATYFGPTRTLTLCNAGHPAPLLYRAAGNTWSLIERQDSDAAGHSELPLGVTEATGYQAYSTRLQRGDLVLCYTDSLIEARQANGQLLGTQGLLKLVREIDPKQPGDLIPALLARLEQIDPANLDHDDVTALLFTTNEQRIGLRDNLMAPIRVIRGWLERLRPAAQLR